MNSKALEAFLIPTTEGLFDRFKHKSSYPTSSQSIIKDVSKEKADPRFLIGASNKSYHGYIPYSNKSIIGNYFHYYEDINPAVNKAGKKIKTIAHREKYDTGYDCRSSSYHKAEICSDGKRAGQSLTAGHSDSCRFFRHFHNTADIGRKDHIPAFPVGTAGGDCIRFH